VLWITTNINPKSAPLSLGHSAAHSQIDIIFYAFGVTISQQMCNCATSLVSNQIVEWGLHYGLEHLVQARPSEVRFQVLYANTVITEDVNSLESSAFVTLFIWEDSF